MHAHVRLDQQSTRAHRYSFLVLSRHTNPVPGVCVAGKGVGGSYMQASFVFVVCDNEL